VGEAGAAQRVENAIEAALRSGQIHNLSTSSGIATPEYTDRVLEQLQATTAQ